MFIRAVRALRDLRRYTAAVTVNNQGGQVNVANDGGQQVNVQEKKGKKRAKNKQQAASAIPRPRRLNEGK